jgi:hypothetical protein
MTLYKSRAWTCVHAFHRCGDLALGDDWDATLRADYYHQASSYASHFNTADYELKSWDN